MKLSEILKGLHIDSCFDEEIKAIEVNSKEVQPQSLFIALPGHLTDGRNYIEEAFAKGAVCVVYEPLPTFSSLPNLQKKYANKLIPVAHLSLQLGKIADCFYQHPSQHIQLTAVTGTNGKSSTCYLLTHFLRLLGQPCGMIGTIGHGFNHALEASVNTTPNALMLQRFLKQFLDQGCRHVVMEASSHGLDQGRMNSAAIKTAILTNITRDHLDYHPTFAAYQQAKQKLFEFESLQTAIINADDPFGRHVLSLLPPHIKKFAYSIEDPEFFFPDTQILTATHIQFSRNGIRASLHTSKGDAEISSCLLGKFNLSNLMGIIAALLDYGHKLSDIVELIKFPPPIPGRMQAFSEQNLPFVVVDYAHTPDALEQILLTLKAFRQEKLITLFGCGGDRDGGKRALMGQAAARYSDEIVLTSDNPRDENPEKIIQDILVGIPRNQKVSIVPDRKIAIQQTILAAKPNDIVIIAGKGHETYQEINHSRIPFNDTDEVKLALREYRHHQQQKENSQC